MCPLQRPIRHLNRRARERKNTPRTRLGVEKRKRKTRNTFQSTPTLASSAPECSCCRLRPSPARGAAQVSSSSVLLCTCAPLVAASTSPSSRVARNRAVARCCARLRPRLSPGLPLLGLPRLLGLPLLGLSLLGLPRLLGLPLLGLSLLGTPLLELPRACPNKVPAAGPAGSDISGGLPGKAVCGPRRRRLRCSSASARS